MLRMNSAFAVVFLCATFAVAEEPRYPTATLDRLGLLPGELIKAKKTDAEIVDSLFLAALARLPTDSQREWSLKHLAAAKDRAAAAQDIAWGLINTGEFMKIHGIDKDVTKTLEFFNKYVNESWKSKSKDEPKPEPKPGK